MKELVFYKTVTISANSSYTFTLSSMTPTSLPLHNDGETDDVLIHAEIGNCGDMILQMERFIVNLGNGIFILHNPTNEDYVINSVTIYLTYLKF